MPILFFLLSVVALLFGVALFVGATTVMQEIAAMLAFLIFAVFLVGCALGQEMSDQTKLMRSQADPE